MDEETFCGMLAGLFRQRSDVMTGPGDDCAVLDLGMPQLILAAADQVVSSVHYLPGTSPEEVAGKLLKRNLSDIAAMGGVPTHALVTVSSNPMDAERLLRFHQGLSDCADRYGVSIIGGDLAKLGASGECSSLTILGKAEKEKLCLRSSAKDGDLIYATGEFGNSFLSGHHLSFEPRLREGLFLGGTYTNAMMDVSDGLLKDTRRMALASGLAFELDPAVIPLRKGATVKAALTEGEDFELVFAVLPEKTASLEKNWNFATRLTKIGVFRTGTPGMLLNQKLHQQFVKTGFDHFS